MLEKAQSESIFTMIGTNIILRTGNIWFCKTEDGYSDESTLNEVGSEMEMPRAELIDPSLFEILRSNYRKFAMS